MPLNAFIVEFFNMNYTFVDSACCGRSSAESKAEKHAAIAWQRCFVQCSLVALPQILSVAVQRLADTPGKLLKGRPPSSAA